MAPAFTFAQPASPVQGHENVIRHAALSKTLVRNMIYLLLFFAYIVSVSSAEEQIKMEKFTTSDGAELAYVDEGNPRLGTIVFVHGGPGYHSAYLRGLASRIKADFRTILYDQRGSGRSGKTVPASSITLEHYVEDLHELLIERKAEKVILLGQSFGGAVALEYVLTHPDGVHRIILENGYADARISMEDRLDGAFDLCQRKNLPEVEAVVRKYKEGHPLSLEDLVKLFGEDVQELYWFDPNANGIEFIEGGREYWGYTQETSSEVGWIVEKFWDQGVLTSYSVLSRLHKIEKPVLVVTGRRDHVISPRHAQEVARRLQKGQLKILEKSGHYPHIEEPEAFRHLIYEFVEQEFE